MCLHVVYLDQRQPVGGRQLVRLTDTNLQGPRVNTER